MQTYQLVTTLYLLHNLITSVYIVHLTIIFFIREIGEILYYLFLTTKKILIIIIIIKPGRGVLWIEWGKEKSIMVIECWLISVRATISRMQMVTSEVQHSLAFVTQVTFFMYWSSMALEEKEAKN